MARRLNLHEVFCEILESKNVYQQPPASVKLSYPCIVYKRYPCADKHNANNNMYISADRYEITVIDRNPNSDIAKKLMSVFPMCAFDRSYVTDNLYHFVLTLYY